MLIYMALIIIPSRLRHTEYFAVVFLDQRQLEVVDTRIWKMKVKHARRVKLPYPQDNPVNCGGTEMDDSSCIISICYACWEMPRI